MELKEKYRDALFIAHPECSPDVLDLADHICSTSGFYTFVKNSEQKRFIIGTEKGVIYRLKKENPDKRV